MSHLALQLSGGSNGYIGIQKIKNNDVGTFTENLTFVKQALRLLVNESSQVINSTDGMRFDSDTDDSEIDDDAGDDDDDGFQNPERRGKSHRKSRGATHEDLRRGVSSSNGGSEDKRCCLILVLDHFELFASAQRQVTISLMCLCAFATTVKMYI